MATTADFRNGLCIKFNNDLFQIIEFQHVKPGKGPAFVRTKLRNFKNGRVIDHTWTSGVKIDTVRIETREHQFLYNDEEGYHFMNLETFEQVSIPEHIINAPQFLKPEAVCLIQFHAEEESPLICELPSHIEAEIVYTEPGLKGDTATNTLKPATIDTGVEIRVPLFVDTGDWIKVDTRTGEYTERIKK
jgi:elongation factor P